MPEHFHFIQPEWFLLLVPMVLLLWGLSRYVQNESAWQQACETHLLPYLLNKPVQTLSHVPLWLLATGWLITVLALADPTWHKQAQAVYRNQDAAVIVLDLSQSMLSSDLTPTRMERARYKVDDILKKRKEGQTGLVVFAGDAFTVSPLTTDTRTIESLLEPLNPDIMPVQGSRVDLGIKKAAELLRQDGQKYGNIILLTDGYSNQDTAQVAAQANREGYHVSVIGIGTEKPTPIPDKNGDFIVNAQGKIVMAALDPEKLQALANYGGGHYHTITVNSDDINDVLAPQDNILRVKMNRTKQVTDKWQSQGPFLILLLLPLAALAFRRGWLLVLPLVIISVTGLTPGTAEASAWDNLWLRADQQAEHALHNRDYKTARKIAKDPMQHGEAAYRSGDYQQALHDFSLNNSATADYNRGNTLAQLGRYKEAITAYDSALGKNSSLKNARDNKKEIEKLLKKQKKSNEKSTQGNNDNNKNKQKQTSSKSDQAKKAGKQNKDAGSKKMASNDSEDQQQNKSTGSKQLAGKDNKHQDQNNQKATKDASRKNRQEDNNKQAINNATSGNKQPNKSEQKNIEKLANKDNGNTSKQPESYNPKKTEQQQADERWLRRIPDDPGGLLRRKFRYQYSQRQAQNDVSQNAW